MKLTMDLTREKAIEMLMPNPNCNLDLDINCDTTKKKLEHALSAIDFEIDNFMEECERHRKDLIIERKRLEEFETHELYEQGEKLDYWKLTEKQKRLI